MSQHRIPEQLMRLLRRSLQSHELALLTGKIPASREEEYDLAINRVARRVRSLEEQVSRNQARVEDGYLNLAEQPEARQAMVLRNSPPQMLLALTYSLIRDSYAQRFQAGKRSLQVAELAAHAADLVAESGYLSPEAAADLQAEAQGYLGNARRISGDLVGAESAFGEAKQLLSGGTGDRVLKADLVSLEAPLRFEQGQAELAAELFDREIKLRSQLGDEERLGRAIVDRGLVGCWFEPLPKACRFLEKGVPLIQDRMQMLLSIHAIAESMARDGRGLDAWRALCKADTATVLFDAGKLLHHQRWIQGITYRALGEYDRAEQDLTAVRSTFLSEGSYLYAALVGLDLAAVHAASGRYAEIYELATEALAFFRSERLERRALTALLVLQQAAEQETATEALALAVANFLARYQRNRNLHFEWPEE